MTPEHVEFHRPARVLPVPADVRRLGIPAPPQVQPALPAGIAQAMLPSLGSIGVLGFAAVSGEARQLVMAGLLTAGMLASALGGQHLQRRRRRMSHRESCERYRRRLSEIRAEAGLAADAQWRMAVTSDPGVNELWSVVVDRTRMWERRPGNEDFLRIRVGSGPVEATVRPRLERSSEDLTACETELQDAAERLEAEMAWIEDCPILVDLGSVGCLAVVGDSAHARAMIAQLAVFRAPDDLRFVVGCDADLHEQWSWARRLPHLHDQGEPVVHTDPERFADAVERLLRPRLDHLRRLRAADETPPFPRAVVVLDRYRPAEGIGRPHKVEEALSVAGTVGVTFICVVDEPAQVPSVADVTLLTRPGGGMVVTGALRTAVSCADEADLDRCAQLARALQPLRLRSRTGRATALDSPSLMELLGLADPSMTAGAGPGAGEGWCPIGTREDGTPIVLDIREPAAGGMGPHGVLIGATGSGKSELLRTIVAGLASRHHPDDLAFVLVDFKGGSAFAPLARLPHVAGMITNLEQDHSLVDRTMQALRGELERRQRGLRDWGGFDRADEYRRHRDGNPGLEPLPTLLIVVDEFSELLDLRPDFVDLFTTIGRLGRSLGVHMLLSTQRIGDAGLRRLEGHLRFRLALRTFTPEESMTVLGSRAAADLPPIPGVGYLRVDGTTTAFKAATVSRTLPGGATEMEEIVGSWAGRSVARQVWTEPLPAELAITEVTTSGGGWMELPVGLEDHPRQQCRPTFRLKLAGRNVAVVGAPRSGKSTLLQTIVLAIGLGYDPVDVQVYAIDMGGGGLPLLSSMTHLGAVLSRNDRVEVDKLLRTLESTLAERMERYRRLRITGPVEYLRTRREGRVEDALGQVVLVIDNWAGLCQELDSEGMEILTRLLGTGPHHGLHVVASSGRWNDIKPSIRDLFSTRVEFRLSDPVDSEIDRRAAKDLPAGIPGRGLSAEGTLVQIALPYLSCPPGNTSDAIAVALNEVECRWPGGPMAPPVRTLPDVVEASSLPAPRGTGVVMGLEEHRLEGWEIDLFGPEPHLLVIGDGGSGRTSALRRLISGLVEGHPPATVQIGLIDYRRRLTATVPEGYRLGVAATAEAAAVLAGRVASELVSRTNGHAGSKKSELVVVVDDYELVAGSGGNPLTPLLESIARGNDLGFHLVIARRLTGWNRSSFEPILQRLRDVATPMLVLSGDPAEGTVAAGVRAASAPPGRGVWVSRGRPTRVQVAMCPPSKSPERDDTGTA